MTGWSDIIAHMKIDAFEESPSNAKSGQLYYNTIVHKSAYFNGERWIAINDVAYQQIDLFNDLNSPRIH